MVSSFIALTAFASTPKPIEIVKSVMEKYANGKSVSVTFRCVDAKTKKVIYTGSMEYEAKSFLRFSLTDPEEGCTAGEDLNGKFQGSTWVTPADMRGYNDTVASRQPYLLADLIQKRAKLDTDYKWDDKVQTIKKGKTQFWRVTSPDGLTLTVNTKTKFITEFVNTDSYHAESSLITTATY